MSQKNRSTYNTETAAKFTPGSNQWTGQEVEDAFIDLSDSVQYVGAMTTMPALNYDCAANTWQEKALTGNSSLTISNAKPGEFYVLVKTGAFTLSLPSGFGPAQVVPAGRYMITFGYDGAAFHFNYSQQVSW